MNEKEMNLAILAELKRIANEVFAKVKVSKDGTYTAAELWNGKNSMGEKIEIFYMGTVSDIYTAKVDTFEFKVSAEDVFLRLWKFEQLCKVKQGDKARFTYGEAEHEIVNEKAMYYTGNYERTYGGGIIGEGDYKVVTRKTTLKKLSEKVAEDKKGRVFYKCNGLWYNISNGNSATVIGTIKRSPNYLMDSLSKYDFSIKNEWTAIYKALYDAMKSERANSTPEERKPENEPKNTVICDKTNEGITKLSENIGKDKDSRVYVRIKHTWYRLVGFGGHDAESIAVEGEREFLYLKSILEEMKRGESGICEQNDKILSMLSEDYPPEPYNEANTDDTRQKIEKCESSCDNQEKKCIVEHVSDIQGKNMRPNYLRQKVFPSELFYARRKISRFKPRYFVGYKIIIFSKKVS